MHILVYKFNVLTDEFLEMKFLESELLTLTDISYQMKNGILLFAWIDQRVCTFKISLILLYYFPKRIRVADNRHFFSLSKKDLLKAVR